MIVKRSISAHGGHMRTRIGSIVAILAAAMVGVVACHPDKITTINNITIDSTTGSTGGSSGSGSSGISMTFLPNPLALHVGTSCATLQIYQLTPHVFPAGVNQGVKFVSPQDSILNIGSTGIVTPTGKIGTTSITAVADTDTTVQKTITATTDSLTCINTPGGTAMRVGSVQQLSTNPANLPGTWTSSRPSVFAVNAQSGITSAVSTNGSATLCFSQAFSATNSVTYGCVTLNASP